MKTLILKTLVITVAAAAALSAQTVAQPGQIAPASEAAFLAGSVSSSSFTLPRQNTYLLTEQKHDRKVNRIWGGSMIAMLAATSMDAGSSWGKREGNPLLASSDGTFGPKGLSIKMGIAAGVIVPELLLRHHKDLKSKFAIGNFAEATIFSGVAIHNFGISAPK